MSAGQSFPPSCWSIVERAAAPDSSGAREALEELCSAYWWPLYAYLRRRGFSGDDSADLVQGLFAELIRGQRFAHADATRGSFRGWLLAALKFHVSHERERSQAARRGGRESIIPFDEVAADQRWAGISHREAEPDRVFERAWAVSLLDRALSRVERAYAVDGKSKLFNVLKPSLVGEPAESAIEVLAVRLRMSKAAVKSAGFRLRRAFGDAVRTQVRLTMDPGSNVDAEIRAIFSALSQK